MHDFDRSLSADSWAAGCWFRWWEGHIIGSNWGKWAKSKYGITEELSSVSSNGHFSKVMSQNGSFAGDCPITNVWIFDLVLLENLLNKNKILLFTNTGQNADFGYDVCEIVIAKMGKGLKSNQQGLEWLGKLNVEDVEQYRQNIGLTSQPAHVVACSISAQIVLASSLLTGVAAALASEASTDPILSTAKMFILLTSSVVSEAGRSSTKWQDKRYDQGLYNVSSDMKWYGVSSHVHVNIYRYRRAGPTSHHSRTHQFIYSIND